MDTSTLAPGGDKFAHRTALHDNFAKKKRKQDVAANVKKIAARAAAAKSKVPVVQGEETVTYAVKVGFITGCFDTWAEAKAATEGYPGAEHKKFNSHAAALEYMQTGSKSATKPPRKMYWTVRGVPGEGVYDTMQEMLPVIQMYPDAEWQKFGDYEDACAYLEEGCMREEEWETEFGDAVDVRKAGVVRPPSSNTSSDQPSAVGGSAHSELTHSADVGRNTLFSSHAHSHNYTPDHQQPMQSTPLTRLTDRSSGGQQARALSVNISTT
jgi:viroplasmin and RNaseH domain-containing protein